MLVHRELGDLISLKADLTGLEVQRGDLGKTDASRMPADAISY